MRKLEKNNVIFIISKNISHKWAIEINGTNFFTQICMLVRALDGTNFNKLFQMLFIKMLLPFLSLSSRRTSSFLSVNHLNARNSWPNNPRFLLALTHFCWTPQLDTKCKKDKNSYSRLFLLLCGLPVSAFATSLPYDDKVVLPVASKTN